MLSIFPLNFGLQSGMASVKHDYKQSFDVLLCVGYIKPFLLAIKCRRDCLMVVTYIIMTKDGRKSVILLSFI